MPVGVASAIPLKRHVSFEVCCTLCIKATVSNVSFNLVACGTGSACCLLREGLDKTNDGNWYDHKNLKDFFDRLDNVTRLGKWCNFGLRQQDPVEMLESILHDSAARQHEEQTQHEETLRSPMGVGIRPTVWPEYHCTCEYEHDGAREQCDTPKSIEFEAPSDAQQCTLQVLQQRCGTSGADRIKYKRSVPKMRRDASQKEQSTYWRRGQCCWKVSIGLRS